jgi:hypothetical protein
MKQKFSLLFGILLSFTFLTAFSHKEQSSISQTSSKIVAPIVEGTWSIQVFTSGGEDQTMQFRDYTFDFFDNGEILARDGVNESTGLYIDDKTNMRLEFGDAPVNQLNGEYTVTERSEDRMTLINNDGRTIEFIRVYYMN